MTTDCYQRKFSELYVEEMYDYDARLQKAKKAIAVLRDHYRHQRQDLKDLLLLDMGCSTGIMSAYYGRYFSSVVGIDIDECAVDYANAHYRTQHMQFYVRDAMNTGFPESTFDIVACSHIYEHVPDSQKLMDEIYRVLRPTGICFFAAQNRLKLIEGHYKLPFLSIIPRPLAHLYLKLLRRGSRYFERHLTYWGLKKLVKDFSIHDYSRKVIEDPVAFAATDMIMPGSSQQRAALLFLKFFYWLCPTYIWLLQKDPKHVR